MARTRPSFCSTSWIPENSKIAPSSSGGLFPFLVVADFGPGLLVSIVPQVYPTNGGGRSACTRLRLLLQSARTPVSICQTQRGGVADRPCPPEVKSPDTLNP